MYYTPLYITKYDGLSLKNAFNTIHYDKMNLQIIYIRRVNLKVLLSNPRGFCAGVVRAIDIVELALKKLGPPIYVKHQIVHNPFVVEDLESKGAITVENLSLIHI